MVILGLYSALSDAVLEIVVRLLVGWKGMGGLYYSQDAKLFVTSRSRWRMADGGRWRVNYFKLRTVMSSVLYKVGAFAPLALKVMRVQFNYS